jgi:hypothetical protein
MNVPVLQPEQLTQLDAWLQCVLWESKLPGKLDETTSDDNQIEIHRLKARLPLSNGQVKLVQGVREIFEIFDAPATSVTSDASKNSQGKIVLIGRYLLNVPFEESFRNMIESST